MRQGDVGGLTLHWLWNFDRPWSGFLRENVKFLERLFYFLVAEDREQFGVDWLEQKPPVDVNDSGSGPNTWRGQLLRSLIKAHLDLDFHGCADSALRLFFRVAGEVEQECSRVSDRASMEDLARTSLWPATVEIMGALMRGSFLHTNPVLYDQMRAWRSAAVMGVEGDAEFDAACLLLYHPLKPSADDMLKVLRQRFDGKDGATLQGALPASSRGRVLLAMKTRQAARILQRQGREIDAAWATLLQKEMESLQGANTRKLYGESIQRENQFFHKLQAKHTGGEA